jgi:peptide/nickel transport system substrate-binding protein
VLRYIGGNAMAQALQNGEANIMNPQPQVDIVNQLKALGDKIKITNADAYTYEHLDFAVNGSFKDLKLRQAFAKCVPRQQIVDNLVKPTNPNAQILQSRYQFPFQPAYQDFATAGGGSQYDKVDIAGAKALMAAAGKPSMTVRIGWRKDPAQLNKRRADTIALIQASCAPAGFKVVDAGTPTFFDKEWPAVNWDVAMFAWAGSPLATGSDGTFTKGGGNNPQGYTNPEIEKLEPALDAEINPDKQTAIQKQIDGLVWKDLATLPLFPFPGIMATTSNVEGVTYNATQADVTWDAYNWNIKQ